jgi:hypothetical protein
MTSMRQGVCQSIPSIHITTIYNKKVSSTAYFLIVEHARKSQFVMLTLGDDD